MNATDTSIHDAWREGEPYERYIGRWSRLVAPEFLAWLAPPGGSRWLDVGCGTGALAAAIVASCAPAQVVGVEPSAAFAEIARRRLGDTVRIHSSAADRLPLDDDSIDATVAGLVLNFVPDVLRALTEAMRVTRPGGTIAAYVWDYAAGMEMIRLFWDAARQEDRGAEALDEAVRFPLCRPDALARAFERAGMRHVETTAIEIATPFDSFEDYWSPFEGGQGPAPGYLASLHARARTRLRERARVLLSERPGGPGSLRARAWCVRGTPSKTPFG